MRQINNLFGLPGARPMVAAGMMGRLPIGIIGLAITLLVVGQTGSYALAGAVTAAQTLALAFIAPFGSRMVDRIGQRRAIPRLIAVNAAATLLLATAVTLDWPVAIWFLAAVLSGSSVPMIGAYTRSRWAYIVDTPDQRSSAFALESVLDELAFVVGPTVATTLSVLLFPAAPVIFALLALSVGGLWLASMGRTAPPVTSDTLPVGPHPVRLPGMASLTALTLTLGGMFGSLNVSTVAFAQERNPAVTGLLLGAFSLGSLISGVLLGILPRRWSLVSQVRVAVASLLFMLVWLPVVDRPAVYGVLAFLGGLSASTIMIAVFGLVERFVPASRLTESLSTSISGIAVGVAAASTGAGLLIDRHGSAWSLVLTATMAALAGGVLLVRGRAMSVLEYAADQAPPSEPQTELSPMQCEH